MPYRSNHMVNGINRAPQRAYLNALGLSRQDFQRPFIAVVNGGNEGALPPNHLSRLLEAVKGGVYSAGGIPFVVNTVGTGNMCGPQSPLIRDLLCMREILADSVEVMVEAHQFDGLVILAAGNTLTAGGLMALLRLDQPGLLLNAGTQGAPEGMDNGPPPDAAACHTMACVAEAMGLSLPGTALTHTMSAKKIRQARTAGQLACKIAEKGTRPRELVTPGSLANGTTLLKGMQGSPDGVVHLMALAREGGLSLTPEELDGVMEQVPAMGLASRKALSSHWEMAGGVPALLAELRNYLHLEERIVTGGTLGELLQTADNGREGHPFVSAGTVGMKITRGSLCPQGGVLTCPKPMPGAAEGSAICFDSEEAALRAVESGAVGRDNVLVVCHMGPSGGEALPAMSRLSGSLRAQGLEGIPVVTDGRLSGHSRSLRLEFASPEAARNGPIGLVRDGDRITVSPENGAVELQVDQEELERRKKDPAPLPKGGEGYLERYSGQVSSAMEGAVLG